MLWQSNSRRIVVKIRGFNVFSMFVLGLKVFRKNNQNSRRQY